MITYCNECGRSGDMMASASRGNLTRHFCHNDERSCYNKRRGRYFEEIHQDPDLDQIKPGYLGDQLIEAQLRRLEARRKA